MTGPDCDDGGWTLREAVSWQDAETVRRITVSSGFFSDQEVQVAMSLVVERMENGAASGYDFLFLEAAGRPLGFACYGPKEARPAVFDLYWLAVLDAERGRGMGRCLLEAAADRARARGGRLLRAETSAREQYAPTRRFYEHNGFELTRLDPDHYAPGEARCIYDRRIGQSAGCMACHRHAEEGLQ